ncbi:MAG: DUF933 domain-containing protein, partial [Pirellulaceae bacterium]|nr:DUF933 domain-containing protein [Pirellulaceae bacterium]
TSQSAMCVVPEPRVAQLCEIYEPKKTTLASLEIVDTPGLSRDHEGSAGRLATIREAGCLVVVAAAFGGNDPSADLHGFDEDLWIADLDIIAGRLERLREQVKKPRPNREELAKELELLTPLYEAMENGQALRDMELSEQQQKVIRAFQLFSEKPRMFVVNTADDDSDFDRFEIPAGVTTVFAPLRLEVELAEMEPAEREAFMEEMGIEAADRDSLIRTIMDVSNQMLFFTAGEKEVRTWMIRKGGTAVEAAGNIHTDLARGFIRAETMTCDDLVRLGSEREVKAQNLARKEHKEYVIQDGDVITIQHN